MLHLFVFFANSERVSYEDPYSLSDRQQARLQKFVNENQLLEADNYTTEISDTEKVILDSASTYQRLQPRTVAGSEVFLTEAQYEHFEMVHANWWMIGVGDMVSLSDSRKLYWMIWSGLVWSILFWFLWVIGRISVRWYYFHACVVSGFIMTLTLLPGVYIGPLSTWFFFIMLHVSTLIKRWADAESAEPEAKVA